ncbi:hypothetical protein Lal_00022978 [Lupinus albus]|nr:hypothetical protein Lal_00022978 [Lupinus albus]
MEEPSTVLRWQKILQSKSNSTHESGTNSLDYILKQNRRILDFCKHAQLRFKQYLPYYTSQEEWQTHFGSRWEAFVERKTTYDPLTLLAPGHRIFQKAMSTSC